jgi:lysophospholipase L1-like esterase
MHMADYNSDVLSQLPPAHLNQSSADTQRSKSLSSSRARGCAARRDEASSPTGGQPVNLWKRLPIGTSALTLALACIAIPSAAAQGIRWKLACTGKSKPADGSRSLSGTRYRGGGETKSFGFDLSASPQVTDSGCSSEAPFFVSVAEPEGNYRVTVRLGSGESAVTTVKAEARRLMIEQLATRPGQTMVRSFVVNIRTPYINPEESVRLKPREIGNLDWDEKLTLEFTGTHPSVRTIEIEPANVPTIYLAGDSTVVDQDKEPWAAWGQMLPRYFNDQVAIANNAESGETIRSFVEEHRLDKVMSSIRSGDYLFIQFAHNDQKPGLGFVPIPEYQDLLRRYIALAGAKGAHPVLVTSMNRRNFAPDGTVEQTLGGYPDAMRQVAREQVVPLIDLNAMSKTLFEGMGPEGTLKAFVHYPANTFPEQTAELKDNTHFNGYGAVELAQCVVESVRTLRLPIAKDIRPDASRFDPAHPDPPQSWTVPVDPFLSTQKPYER